MNRRIVIKVGTKVLTDDKGVLDRASLVRIVDQIAQLKRDNYDIVLVSSGAMGAGKSLLKTTKRLTDISEKQLFAAIGQAHLIHEYSDLFRAHSFFCAQVLATKEDFRDTSHFFNMRNCLETLLHDNVIPIVNENDVVALSELTFTDNDELAGLVTSMLDADRLVILSSIDGMLDDSGAVIPTITLDDVDSYRSVITTDKSEAGRGGMITKFAIAKKLARQGVEVIIANGAYNNTILKIASGTAIGTHFLPGKKQTSVKRRVAHSENLIQGSAHVNEHAVPILRDESTAASLLLVGVTDLSGEFKKGDVIDIQSPDGVRLGYGISQYDHDEAATLVGRKNVKPLIHYDYLFIE